MWGITCRLVHWCSLHTVNSLLTVAVFCFFAHCHCSLLAVGLRLLSFVCSLSLSLLAVVVSSLVVICFFACCHCLCLLSLSLLAVVVFARCHCLCMLSLSSHAVVVFTRCHCLCMLLLSLHAVIVFARCWLAAPSLLFHRSSLLFVVGPPNWCTCEHLVLGSLLILMFLCPFWQRPAVLRTRVSFFAQRHWSMD